MFEPWLTCVTGLLSFSFFLHIKALKLVWSSLLDCVCFIYLFILLESKCVPFFPFYFVLLLTTPRLVTPDFVEDSGTKVLKRGWTLLCTGCFPGERQRLDVDLFTVHSIQQFRRPILLGGFSPEPFPSGHFVLLGDFKGHVTRGQLGQGDDDWEDQPAWSESHVHWCTWPQNF